MEDCFSHHQGALRVPGYAIWACQLTHHLPVIHHHYIFKDLLNQSVVAYIDDILIYSKSEAEHINHVKVVLSRLLENQLYVKAEKCEFHVNQTSFLVYHISHHGVKLDELKVQAVTEWPQPSIVKELQRFLGFANFYRRFIRNYSTVASPLTSLLKGKPTKLRWTGEANNAFITLKEKFLFERWIQDVPCGYP